MNSNETEIQAGEWLARLDRDDADPADLATFDQWIAADPRHAAAYGRLAATWQALDRIRAIRPSADEPINNDYLNGVLPQPSSGALHISWSSIAPQISSSPLHYSLPDAFQRAVAEPHHSARLQTPFSAHRRPWFFFSIAASLLIAFAGLWIVHAAGGTQIIKTGVGGFQRIVLADQSVIELNTATEVRIALSAQVRQVELVRGEASFEVAHDATRPFIVSAGNMAVRAVGTRFEVRRLDNSVEVTVDEGKVIVGAPKLLETPLTVIPPTMLRLSAGETATSSGSGVTLKSLPESDLARKLAWHNQMLVFDGDSLADVVAQFNRYNERQLVIADPNLASLQIGGYFRPTNLDAFTSVLQSNFGIRVNTVGNRLVLAAASSN